MKNTLETYWFDCICTDPDHAVRFTKDYSEERGPELYIAVADNIYHGFWGRLKHAIRYVFTPRKLEGFDTFIMSHDDASKFFNTLTDYDIEYRKWEESRLLDDNEGS